MSRLREAWLALLRGLPSQIRRAIGAMRRPLGIALVACVAYVMWVLTMPKPVTLTSVNALSERIEIVVSNPLLAAIPLVGMRRVDAEGAPCAHGLLRPDLGATVAYERGGGSEPLTISIEQGGGVYEPSIDPPDRIVAPYTFEEDKDCIPKGETAPHRLPIVGELRIAREMRPASQSRVTPGLLLEGKLQVQARALDRLHVLYQPPTLYGAAEIDLPLGTRIEARGRPRQMNWFGAARLEQGPGLRIMASTEAPRLLVFRPGRTDAETIEITRLTQIVSDPNIIRMQILLGGVIAILALTTNLVGAMAKP